MSTQPSRKKIIFIAINLFWFLVIFFLTHITPVHSDDVILAHIFGTDQPIRTLHDFFSSIWIHQMTWGGNLVGWGICQMFAIMPRVVFELCNGLVWVGAANLICRYACADRDMRNMEMPVTLCLIYLALWFFVPSLYDNLWLNAAIEYLWFNTLTLLFGYILVFGPAVLLRRDLTPWRRAVLSAAMFLFGFAVSACVKPSTGCTLPAAMGLGAIWAVYRKKKFNVSVFIAAFLGVLIGFCVCTFSPGHFARAAEVAAKSPQTASLLYRFVRGAYYGMLYTLIPLAITLFFVMLNRARHPYRELDELFFVLLAIVNIAVLTIPSGFAPRAVLFSDMLLIIAGGRSALRLFADIPTGNRVWLKRALWVLIAFLTAFALLEIATSVMLHLTKGAAPDRQTIYFAQYFELFG